MMLQRPGVLENVFLCRKIREMILVLRSAGYDSMSIFIVFISSKTSVVISSTGGNGSLVLGASGERGSIENIPAMGLGSAMMVAQVVPAGRWMGLSLQLESRMFVLPFRKVM